MALAAAWEAGAGISSALAFRYVHSLTEPIDGVDV
jgi:hypothetical protein